MNLTGTQIKLIALFFMFTEHFGEFFPQLLPGNLPLYLEYTGRIVFPLFIFLAIEGFHKTSSKKRYITRLYLWALFMQIGNVLLYYVAKNILHNEHATILPANIFLSLALGVSVVAILYWARGKNIIVKYNAFLGIFALAFISLFAEASFYTLLIFIPLYYAYQNKNKLIINYTVTCIIILIINLLYATSFWQTGYQWMMIAALPLMLAYNGQRGALNLKYFFYAFYPVHLWIMYLLSNVL